MDVAVAMVVAMVVATAMARSPYHHVLKYRLSLETVIAKAGNFALAKV